MRRPSLLFTLGVALLGLCGAGCVNKGSGTTNATSPAPLRVHPANPHYFTDGTTNADGGLKAIYLTGSHTWLNLQDGNTSAGLPAFDYIAYLDFLQKYHHNFIRLWAWEGSLWIRENSERITLSPLPFVRAGPGLALDGKPKFDVTRFDESYFKRLRERVAAARDRGLYVGVMLFEGFSVARKDRKRIDSPWLGHPLNAANNVNGLDGDTDGDGNAYEAHTLAHAAITRVQESYVRKVVETLNDLDNVVYEISNESHGGSTAWQYHFIEFIRRCEQTMPKLHLVWMSYCWDGLAGAGTMADLFASPAEIISPTGNDRGSKAPRRYRENPPSDASKIILSDTDHLWGVGGDRAWVWKSFLRGMHPIFMDPYRHSPFHPAPEPDPKWEDVRIAMGQTLRFADLIDLAAMRPHDNLASTAYCLASPGREYLVYAPTEGEFTVDLSAAPGPFEARWFNPRVGTTTASSEVTGGSLVRFQSPGSGDWVLHVRLRTE